MRKKELLKRGYLCATTAMVKHAKSDIPQVVRVWHQEKIKYTYELYMRCRIEENRLLVSLFHIRDLRLGNRRPMYQIFIDKVEDDFITWDENLKKWRNAKIDMLFGETLYFYPSTWIFPKDNLLLKSYLGVKRDGYRGILEFQQGVRERQLTARHRKETDVWDAKMALVPDLPENWKEWVDREGMKQHYIFYDYTRRKHKTGYCSWCKSEVEIHNPKHNQFGICELCGHNIQFKAKGRTGRLRTEQETVYILQAYGDGMVVRQFNARRDYQKERYETPDLLFFEERRAIFDAKFNLEAFEKCMYKQKEYRWVEESQIRYGLFNSNQYRYHSRDFQGASYVDAELTKNFEGLKRTGLLEALRGIKNLDPETYLSCLKTKPYLEQLVKAELFKVAEDILHHKGELEIAENPDFAKVLGIDHTRLRRLRENQGGIIYLKWLVQEKKENRLIPEETMQFFVESKITPADVAFIVKQMSPVRIQNYLNKQVHLSSRTVREVIFTWHDYISMNMRVGRDITKELIYRPTDLKKAHAEIVELCEKQDLSLQAEDMLKNYPGIEDNLKEIKEKYQYQGEEYQIVVPERVVEIMEDGRALRHCTRYHDIYYDRINRKESFILFLRRAEAPDQAYYTLEVEPDGTVRQMRTLGDEQNDGYEQAVAFIKVWQKVIGERLSKADWELAKQSSRLREEELQELRDSGRRIWNGHLKGKLLADVLEQDLMEVELAMEEDTQEQLSAA